MYGFTGYRTHVCAIALNPVGDMDDVGISRVVSYETAARYADMQLNALMRPFIGLHERRSNALTCKLWYCHMRCQIEQLVLPQRVRGS